MGVVTMCDKTEMLPPMEYYIIIHFTGV